MNLPWESLAVSACTAPRCRRTPSSGQRFIRWVHSSGNHSLLCAGIQCLKAQDDYSKHTMIEKQREETPLPTSC